MKDIKGDISALVDQYKERILTNAQVLVPPLERADNEESRAMVKRLKWENETLQAVMLDLIEILKEYE